MQETLRTLIVQFDTVISPFEVPLFRGAILSVVKNCETNLLFHNHKKEGNLRYSYPLIQYKRLNGKAAMVCVGEGTENMNEYFPSSDFDLKIGKRSVSFSVDAIIPRQTVVQVNDEIFEYVLADWIPFDSENYYKYKSMDAMIARLGLMENILVGNMLSFAKGIGVFLDKPVKCQIIKIQDPKPCMYKGVRMMSFDLFFKSNVSLPEFIGLGKGVSLGFGTIAKLNK